PGGMAGAGEMGPPPAKDQAAATYAANAGEDSLASLIADLQQQLLQLQSESGNQGTSTDTTSINNTKNRHEPQDFFKKVDADGNDTVSKDELAIMAENLQKMTGQSIAVNTDTVATADGNGDGVLNNEELKSFMDKSGFTPPPPPEEMDMAMSSDTAKTGSTSTKKSTQEQIDLLKIMLEKLTQFSKETESTASASLLNVSA
ncbi:MAG: hypothetical protein Q8R42_06290, partial [Desulfocapsaceae bacterium]|nr:hypothetical protein [Desulfocapsaceae bacterium]